MPFKLLAFLRRSIGTGDALLEAFSLRLPDKSPPAAPARSTATAKFQDVVVRRPTKLAQPVYSRRPMTESAMPSPRLNGATILSLESRRRQEMEALIRKQGGVPEVAPSMREVPLEDQTQALQFADELVAGRCDVLVLLTGVGLTALMATMETRYSRTQLLEALGKTLLVCRGPKPASVLRSWGLSGDVIAPEPNTTETLLAELQRHAPVLNDKRAYIQEYGASAAPLAAALERRGALARTVPIYAWQLPEELGPLQRAVSLLAERRCQALLLTSAQQLRHLALVAETMHLWQEVVRSLHEHVVVASIGPVTTEALLEIGVTPDMEPAHPKMGRLVSDLANRWSELALKPSRCRRSEGA